MSTRCSIFCEDDAPGRNGLHVFRDVADGYVHITREPTSYDYTCAVALTPTEARHVAEAIQRENFGNCPNPTWPPTANFLKNTGPMIEDGQRELTPGEEASLEKVGMLRAFSGRMRAAIRDALDQLRPDEPAAKILQRALSEGAP